METLWLSFLINLQFVMSNTTRRLIFVCYFCLLKMISLGFDASVHWSSRVDKRNNGYSILLITKFMHDKSRDDDIRWKRFSRYWPFVRVIHRSLVTPRKGQWRGILMFSLICAWINGWVNNREAGDLRRHCAHYDVTVMVDLLQLIARMRVVLHVCYRTSARNVHFHINLQHQETAQVRFANCIFHSHRLYSCWKYENDITKIHNICGDHGTWKRVSVTERLNVLIPYLLSYLNGLSFVEFWT